VPLSYSQELLWLLSHVFYGGVAYNSPAALRLQGRLAPDVLERALEALVARHEILRTTYRIVGDQPMQIVADEPAVELRRMDLSALPADERERELQRFLNDESQVAIDLVEGPVIRPTLIRLGPEEHVLMVMLHHIATDGYSRAIFLDDLTALYESIRRGEPSPLPPLPIQYADYAVWHRTWLEQGVLETQLAYWKETLAGAPSRLDLPTDFARPPVRSYVGDHESVGLDQETLDGLRASSRAAGGTLFVGLVSLFAALLQRYSGQDDIVIGTPFAGRTRKELEGMIGYFINPLALRVDLSGDPSFAELLRRTRETTVSAFAHADVPYEMIVRATSPERDLSQTPVFQTMLVLHNPEWLTRRPTFQPEGIVATEVRHGKGWAKFDVLVGMSERTTGLNTTWEYSTELFKPETVRQMMEHFRTLAGSAAASPDRRLSKLPMLGEAERAKLVRAWNGSDVAVSEAASVKEQFEQQAARTPDATAVVFESEELAYGELNRRANRLAWLLRESADVGPGAFVGIMLEKSLDAVVAVLAVMKAGAAYIPLDPNYPADRLEFMLEDSNPQVLVTRPELAETLPARSTALVVDVSSEDVPATRDDDPPTAAGPDDIAYAIYTSGSTGMPKAALIANRSLASAFYAYEQAYRLSELRCHAQLASFSFDVFTGDIVRALLVGAKLVLCPMDTVVDPARLYALMVEQGVDAVELVPATAGLLFEYAEREGKRLDFMRLISIGGEAWRTDRYAAYRRLCGPDTRLINSYGLTEATMDSTWFEPQPDEVLPPGRFMPIGRPFANTRVYILDANMEPVPVGIPGELCIGGVAVGRGYLNLPELTAARFVDDPFADEPGARLYRTGDLARRLADGTIEFVGRADRQLKIRGFRVEPGEVEAVLERHNAVQTAVVVSREDPSGETRLVAYLVPADRAAPPSPDELYGFAGEHVPAHMLPSAWVVLDAPPLTPNGKVDVDALPAPEWGQTTTSEHVAPRTETERALAAIWAAVLGVDDVGVTDNFFVLGGHSLMAVRLFGRIEERFGKKLPLTSLFRGATVEQLADMIDEDRRSDTPPTIVPVRPQGTRPPLFIIGGIDGEVIHYRALVAALDPDQPVYALQPSALGGAELPKTTMEELAADYVRDLEAFLPGGPHLLTGYCYSGYVAYEVARQLEERGTPAALLALIDTGPGLQRRRVDLERQKFKDFMSRDLRGKAAWVRRRASGLRHKVGKRLIWTTFDLLAAARLPMPARVRSVREASYRAWAQYMTRPAPVKLTLFRAVEPGLDWRRTALWSQIATGGVDVVPLQAPGIAHDNLIRDPYVHTLARGLEYAIDLAVSANGRSEDAVDGDAVGLAAVAR
jgi:amino acid adenylation domain-containing protein